MQNLKIDKNQDGEAVLSAGRYVPWLTDGEGRSFKTGSLMWSEHRFRDVPGLMGHAEYEQMSAKLKRTSQWELAQPPPKFQPGSGAHALCKESACEEVRVCFPSDAVYTQHPFYRIQKVAMMHHAICNNIFLL